MTAPYYSDDFVTLYQGRCEDILPTLSLSGSVHLITDPPYFKVKADAWDNQWKKSSEFLQWMGEWLRLAKPLLSADASVWVFASPKLTSAVESVVAAEFRVLNSVRWVKSGGDNLKRVSLPAMRSMVSIWEGIIFAEQFGQIKSGYESASEGVWRDVFTPIREYLAAQRDLYGVTNRQVDAALGTAGMAGHYFSASQWALPTAEAWAKICTLIPFDREYEDLRREYEDLRRPYNVNQRDLSTDVWTTFPSVSHYPGKHPCEKPAGLLAHIIETTTRPGDTIIDCFAGSGAVLDVARQLGRKAVGIEMDAKWCEHARTRLSAPTLQITPRAHPRVAELRSSGWSGSELPFEMDAVA